MATTGQGPASMTVTGVSCPVSWSKTWVMPSLRPTIPFTPCSLRRESRTTRAPRVGTLEAEGGPRWPRAARPLWQGSRASELDLDVHARREVQPHQGVDRLRCRRVDVDQALVRAHLEVLTRVLVLERAPDHRVDVLLGGQRHRPGDGRAGALRRLDDRQRRPVELTVVVSLQADADLLLRQGPFLLLDLRHDAGADGATALADGEAEPLIHGDRLDEIDLHVRVVARHDHLLALRQLDRAGDVGRAEVELRPVAVEERRMAAALVLGEDVHLGLELRVRRDRARLGEHLAALHLLALRPAQERARVVARLGEVERLVEHLQARDDRLLDLGM